MNIKKDLTLDEKFLSAIVVTIKKAFSKGLHTDFLNHLSLNKLESKKWLVNNINFSYKKVLILGSWYPTYLPYMLGKADFTFVDLDPNVIELSKYFLKSLYGDLQNFKFITADARSFLLADNTDYDLIINTSCEHMNYDMKPIIWNKKPIYAFQSNNYEVPSHVNCKNSLEDFTESSGILNIYYSGILKFPKYDRYMVIGKL